MPKLLAAAAIATLLLAGCTTPPPPPPPPAPQAPAPAVAHFDSFAYQGHDAVFDHVKAGPTQYLNPILPGYYPDPSILRVDKDYYLVNSSFTHFPGLPVWHSTDLVHWTQIGNAVDRPSQADFGHLEVSRGLFAPTIRYRDGTFYIINTCVDCGGNFYLTAKDPKGPWSDPIQLPFEGIDPSFFFDRNGRAYIVNNGMPQGTPLYDGHRAIWLQEFDLKTQKMIGPRKVLINGGTDIRKKPVWIEGPHLYRIKGWYYLMCAEGGTGEQHSEVIFRSKKLWGPYLSYKKNPILTQRDLYPDREFPVTSTGHADLVYTGPVGLPSRSSRHAAGLRRTGYGPAASTRFASEGWYAVFLGTRPYADDLYNTGRETFMLPVTWKNGWPIILKKGAHVPFAVKRPNLPPEAGPQPHAGNFSYDVTFDHPLGFAWVTIRTPHDQWYSVADGALNLNARPVAIGADGNPSFVARRLQNADAEISVGLRFDPKIDGERAGLVAFQNSDDFYFLGVVREHGSNSVCVFRRTGKDEPENGVQQACTPAASGETWLKIAIHGGKADFYAGVARDKLAALLTEADATILSTKKAGGFVGTVIGPYAYSP